MFLYRVLAGAFSQVRFEQDVGISNDWFRQFLLYVAVDSLLIVTLYLGFCNCSMFCCALLCVHSSFAIISMGKGKLVALPCLSCWCLVFVVWLFLAMPQVYLQFAIVVFLDLITYYFLTFVLILH